MKETIWWSFPNWAHNLFLRVTGYRLVKIQSENYPYKSSYSWTKEWPLPGTELNRV